MSNILPNEYSDNSQKLESYKSFLVRYEKKKMIKNTDWGTIDLGIIPGNNIYIEYDGTVAQKFSGSSEDGIYDAIAIDNGKYCSIGATQADHVAYRFSDGWGWANNTNTYDRHIWGLSAGSDGMKIFIDENQVWSSAAAVTIANKHSYLFGQYRHPQSQIFSAKVYSDGNLYMDLIPAYDLLEKKVGLFDNISYKFFTCSTAGSYEDLDDTSNITIYKNYVSIVNSADAEYKNYKTIIYHEGE